MKEEEIRKRAAFNRYLELVGEDVQTIFADRASFARTGCPACGGDEHQRQFEKLGFTYVTCTACGTLFVNPRPPIELLMDFYTNSRSSTFWVNEFFKPVAEVRREKIFRPRAAYVRDTMPNLSDGVIGDMGAGFGLFLEELAGFWPAARLVAIEPAPEMAAMCKQKGLEVIASAVEDVQGWDGRFSLLTSFELFEHLHDPGEFVRKAWNMLRPGGYLLLTTLNAEGFDIQVLWEKSRSVAPPSHLNFFTPRAIAMLLRENGFIVDTADTPGKLDWDIVEGMYREERVDPGRFWKLVAEQAEPAAKSSLQDWITANGLSSHMRVLARKAV